MSPKGNPKSGESINQIKEVLADQGRTQAWLADQLGYSTVAVMSFCNNVSQPHLKDLKKIAGILDVDIRDLLYPTKGPEFEAMKDPDTAASLHAFRKWKRLPELEQERISRKIAATEKVTKGGKPKPRKK